MEPYSEVQEHDPANITLLCGYHHHLKTSKLLTVDQVKAKDAEPHNVTRGITAPFGLNLDGKDEAEVRIGSDVFRSNGWMYPIVVDDFPLVGISRDDDGGITLSMVLYDRYNLQRVEVYQNELLMFPENIWDVQFEAQLLTVREALGHVDLRVRFEPPNRVTFERAKLRYNGVLIEADQKEIRLGGKSVRFSGNRWMNAPVGFTVGYCPRFPTMASYLHLQADRYCDPPAPVADSDLGTDATSDAPPGKGARGDSKSRP